jgi:TrpR-related protein YerC/YecD
MERTLRRNDSLWSLFEVVVNLKDTQECGDFFRDLCTLAELKAMAERWQIVQLVAQQMPYRRISEVTGASTATITRIAHWYQHGEGGYRMAIERLQQLEQAESPQNH